MNEPADNVSAPSVESKGIAGLLGNPEGFIRKICIGGEGDAGREGTPGTVSLRMTGMFLLLLALGGMALFGFGAGCFVDWKVAFIDAAKAGGIVLFGYLLCLPTLYVFASIAGCKVGFVRLALIGLVALAGIGCILAALAPVLWLFAVSTESAAFFTLLAFALIGVAVVLGARTLRGAVRAGAVSHSFGLSAWFVVFLVVALQTITLVRPMLAPVGTARAPTGKCFFLAHFYQSITEGGAR